VKVFNKISKPGSATFWRVSHPNMQNGMLVCLPALMKMPAKREIMAAIALYESNLIDKHTTNSPGTPVVCVFFYLFIFYLVHRILR
jgi:hypothetical protein